MKRLLIRLGFHGRCHDKARIRNEIKKFNGEMLNGKYWLWQGEHGATLNEWRMK